MKKSTNIIFYASSSLILCGLIWAGFIYRAEPDVGTLINSAQLQLQIAAGMPAKGKDGTINPAHGQLVEESRKLLQQAEAREPGLLQVCELRARLFYVEGNYRRSAEAYRDIREHKDVTPDMADMFVLNESRMWRAAALPASGLKAIQAHDERFLSKNRASSRIETARNLFAMKRPAESQKLCTAIINDTEEPTPLMEVGLLLEGHKAFPLADQAFAKAQDKQPRAAYFRARLKIKQEQGDTALDLLERAVLASARQTRAWVRQDKEIWAPLAKSERFKGLINPGEAVPSKGR